MSCAKDAEVYTGFRFRPAGIIQGLNCGLQQLVYIWFLQGFKYDFMSSGQIPTTTPLKRQEPLRNLALHSDEESTSLLEVARDPRGFGVLGFGV